MQRYLDGDPIEAICHEMGCAKSWLYKWKHRYQATEPTWAQEHSRRPETTPTKTPEGIEAAIIQLRQTLSPDGADTVSARVIQDHLSHHATRVAPFASHDLSHSQPSDQERGFTVRDIVKARCARLSREAVAGSWPSPCPLGTTAQAPMTL